MSGSRPVPPSSLSDAPQNIAIPMKAPLGQTKLKTNTEVTNMIQEAAIDNSSSGPLCPATYLQNSESLLTRATTRIALNQNESNEQAAGHHGLNDQQLRGEEERLQNVKEVIADALNTFLSKIEAVEKRHTETAINIAKQLHKDLKNQQTAFEQDL